MNRTEYRNLYLVTTFGHNCIGKCNNFVVLEPSSDSRGKKICSQEVGVISSLKMRLLNFKVRFSTHFLLGKVNFMLPFKLSIKKPLMEIVSLCVADTFVASLLRL